MNNLKILDAKLLTKVVEVIYPADERSVQYIPSIFDYASQGIYYCKTPGLTLSYISGEAIVTANSDVVQVGEYCIYEKAFRPTVEKNIFLDKNLIQSNLEAGEIYTVKPTIAGRIGKAYSLLGTHSHHWGHFIAEYYPSFLAILPILPEDVVIILPANLDQIQIELIKFALNACSKTNKACFCPLGQSIVVEQLYVAEKASLLSDHSDWISPYDNIIQSFCNKELLKFSKAVHGGSELGAPRKIFLTRRSGSRRVSNIDQVESFFQSNDYEIVDPTLLTHHDRIKLFYACREVIPPPLNLS